MFGLSLAVPILGCNEPPTQRAANPPVPAASSTSRAGRAARSSPSQGQTAAESRAQSTPSSVSHPTACGPSLADLATHDVVVEVSEARVFVRPAVLTAGPVAVASRDTILDAIGIDRDWYLIRWNSTDGIERRGYVHCADVSAYQAQAPTTAVTPDNRLSSSPASPATQPAPAPPTTGTALVTSANAPLFGNAERVGLPEVTLATGTVVTFLSIERRSYRVEVAARSGRPRVGFVDPRLLVPNSRDLEPMDLSVRDVYPVPMTPEDLSIPDLKK